MKATETALSPNMPGQHSPLESGVKCTSTNAERAQSIFETCLIVGGETTQLVVHSLTFVLFARYILISTDISGKSNVTTLAQATPTLIYRKRVL